MFHLAGRGDYDMVVAMYHDQGHISIKALGLESRVNITVGLPVIPTSVDHGTALDIAGKTFCRADLEQTVLKETMMKHARKTVVLADFHKINRAEQNY